VSKYVVDASVAIKWYVPEIHSVDADRLLSGDTELLVPDLLWSEIGNILWKRILRADMTAEKSRTIIAAITSLPLRVMPAADLMEGALSVAVTTKRSFYDSLYLYLAVSTDCQMVTADLKLFTALKNSPFAQHILWVEDMPK